MNIAGIEEIPETDNAEVDCLEIEDDGISVDSAELVANWLVAKYRSKLIYSCIDDVFGEIDEEERNAVFSRVCDIISGRYSVERLEYIKRKIIEFFESDKKMNIDGFVSFRLKSYKDELRILVEECGCDMLADRNYNNGEYLELLEIIDFLLDMEDIFYR